MISAAAIPSMPGMLMSITTMSGRSSMALVIASSPEPASPATSISLLEAQELREVIARLRDVVDDQDLDHVMGTSLGEPCSLARSYRLPPAAGPGWPAR